MPESRRQPEPTHGGGKLLIAILVLAALLRFVCIGQKSLWLDETMSVRLARMSSFGEMFREAAGYDVHPPLFASLHWLWMRLGDGDGLARVPSAVFGVAGVWMLYLLAKRLLGERAALVAASMLAVSSYHLYYSQEARQYALVVFLTLALSWLAVRITQAKPGQEPVLWGAYALLGAVCLYTFVMSLVVIAGHGVLFLLYARRTRRNMAWGGGAMVAIALLFLPWVPVLRRRMETIEQIARMQGRVPGPDVVDLLTAPREWMLAPVFVLRSGTGVVEALLGLVCLALMALGIWQLRKRRRTTAALLCLLFVPLLAFLALPVTRVHRFDPKHLIVLQPICLLAVAALLAGGKGRPRPAAWLLPGLVALVNVSALAVYYAPGLQKARWPEAAAFVAQHDDVDCILVEPSHGVPYAFQRYYKGDAPILGWKPEVIGPDRKLAPRFRRIWLIGCWNEVIKSSPGLVAWFNEHTDLVEEGVFVGGSGRTIRCALYESRAAAEAAKSPGAPAP